jgi:two-component system OmpR family sensor kinase
MVLLTLFGIAVGGTTEVFLRSQLYTQFDEKLFDAQRRSNVFFDILNGKNNGPPNSPNGVNSGSGNNQDRGRGPGGLQPGTILVELNPSTKAVIAGGKLSDSGTQFAQTTTELAADTKTALAAIVAGGKPQDLDLGSVGDYRLVAVVRDNVIQVTGLPLVDLQSTLLKVALVTGAAILITLISAGWVGAFIVRGTLRPLRRVAATATRVSELKLDRGEVQLAQRVPARDTDANTEVGQVGAALNRMLDHVGNALEARHASETQVRQFVADASHELRTPLAAIRGYAELSRRSRAPISDEIAHVLSRVESEAKRMTLLVEDLLLLARLDAGRPLAHDPVDLTMMVVDAISDAHAAGPRYYWQLDLPEEPVFVVGDGARLHQVLANLLANARTHTPEGTTVTVRVGSTPDAAIMQVIDSGPGIPPELQPRIFERFARGDSSRSRAAGSTGLGLSIVHAVVTAHRGSVSVQSVPGQTVFTVVLPLMPPHHMPNAGYAGPATGTYPVSPTGQFAQIAPGRR